MTKQSIVVPEAVAVVMPVASGSSSLLQFPPPRSTGAGRYDVDRKLLAHLELRGRINGWVESMKASSPTHSLEDAINPWIVKRPSALEVFDEIASRFAGKQMVMFLDYDGTLSPIVNDPDRAFMSDDMRSAVRDVAGYFPTAIVTGRCCDKVCSFVRLPELYYAGSHGMDIKGPENLSSSTNPENKAVLFQPASEFFPMIEKVYNALLEKTSSVPGTKVENNRFCVSVHFRCVDEKRWSALAEQVRSVMKEYPKLRLTQGRKVLEIRPSIKWDKGKALEFLLESLGFSNREDVLPIYIGDDRTDEDAFKVLRDRGQGFGVLVSKFPKETNAAYSLQDPSEVMDFLNCLVEWKRLSSEARAKSANRVST